MSTCQDISAAKLPNSLRLRSSCPLDEGQSKHGNWKHEVMVPYNHNHILQRVYAPASCLLLPRCTSFQVHVLGLLIESWRHIYAPRKRVKVRPPIHRKSIVFLEYGVVGKCSRTLLLCLCMLMQGLWKFTYFSSFLLEFLCKVSYSTWKSAYSYSRCWKSTSSPLLKCSKQIKFHIVTKKPIAITPDMQLHEEQPDVNYFVCTLGQAASLNAEKPHSFKTINDFVDLQARQYPTRPAVGFPIPPKNKDAENEWNSVAYSKWDCWTHHWKWEANHSTVSFPRLTTTIDISGT